MKFQYYWDLDDLPAENPMAGPADIQKLIERMKRADALTNRAVTTGARGDAIMDAFEATLSKTDDHFDKIHEYNKTLDAMVSITGNGGPALEETFQPLGFASLAPDLPVPENNSTIAINHSTGDPIK